MLSHDSRLRCDMVDMYYALYGTKRPPGMVSSELSAMFRPQKVSTATTTSTNSTITPSAAPLKVKAENKMRVPSPIEEKPLHILDIVEVPDEPLISVDDAHSSESGVLLLLEDVASRGAVNDVKPVPLFGNAAAIQVKSESDGSNSRQTIKEEIIDVDELDKDGPPVAKKPKTDYGSDNSASLPGIAAGGSTGPVGFEPGMFKQDDGAAEVTATGSGKTKGDSAQKVTRRFSFNRYSLTVSFVL